MANSAISNGSDQLKRKMSQGIKKAAPPFCATMRGNRHMFPVPTAIPRQTTIKPHREEEGFLFGHESGRLSVSHGRANIDTYRINGYTWIDATLTSDDER